MKQKIESTPRILNLIIRDMSSKAWRTNIESFFLDESVCEPEEALRGAVQDFLLSGTDEAKQAISYACGCFNWGDALSSIPNSFFESRGLHRMSGYEAIDVNVEHDEILIMEKDDE